MSAPSDATVDAGTRAATMDAMLLHGFGGPELFRPGQHAVPRPGPGEVLVRVVASSVNPADCKIRANGGPLAPALPAVLGMDVAGTVVDCGAGVQDFAPGMPVYGCAGGVGGLQGALAGYMVADARLLAPAPTRLPLREAAALPLVSITAWEGLFDRARLRAGQSLLVLAASGGVGHVAVQLGAIHRARVTAVVGDADKAARARAHGAHEVLLRGEATAESLRERFDVVFDASGRGDHAAALDAARVGGQVVSIVTRGEARLDPMHAKGLSLHAVFMLLPMLTGEGRERHGEILRAVAGLVDAGRLAPQVDPRRFALHEVGAAHALLEGGGAAGKLVIDVGGEA